MRYQFIHFAFLLLFPAMTSLCQQVPDVDFNPVLRNVTYDFGKGPLVFIDEGHHNFHTKDGRYGGFARLLEKDGYIVEGYKKEFELTELKKSKIFVISNSLHESNVGNWILPNPSAFTSKEIDVMKEWVIGGGSLFLIADHMPLAGAAEELAAAFGFHFSNGFVMPDGGGIPSFFKVNEGTLIESVITKGRSPDERVQQVATFTGQAFQAPTDATPILVFKDDHINLLPDTAWRFNESTKRQRVEGWSQGAYKKIGKGRIVVFGEAAMFSAQLSGPARAKMGMNSPLATENYLLLLNIIHWLDGKLN